MIQENEKKRNGRFVPDARDHFDFGATTIISESLLADRLATTLNTFSTAPNGPLLLLCHDPRAEITALKMLNIDADAFKTGLGGLLATLRGGGKAEGVWVVDTQDLYRGWRGEKKQEKLENCCSVLQVPTRRLHNVRRLLLASSTFLTPHLSAGRKRRSLHPNALREINESLNPPSTTRNATPRPRHSSGTEEGIVQGLGTASCWACWLVVMEKGRRGGRVFGFVVGARLLNVVL